MKTQKQTNTLTKIQQPSQLHLSNQQQTHQSQNINPNCFHKLSKKQKISFVIISFFIIGIIILSAIALKNKFGHSQKPILQLPKNVSSGQIGTELSKIIIDAIQLQKDSQFAVGFGTNYQKFQIKNSLSNIVVSQKLTQNNQTQYQVNVPLPSIIERSYSNGQKLYTIDGLKRYLEDYPQKALQLLIKQAKIRLYQPFSYKDGTKIVDNLTLAYFQHNVNIEIYFNPQKQYFQPSIYSQLNENVQKINLYSFPKQFIKSGSNLQSQLNQNTLISTDQDSQVVDSQQQNLFIRLIGNGVWAVKQIASTTIDMLNDEKVLQMIKYQQSKVETVDSSDEWKKTLLNDCVTVGSLKFRCNVNTVNKLIPQLSIQKIKSNNQNYSLVNSFKIILQRSQQM